MPLNTDDIEQKFQKGMNLIRSGQVKKAESTLLDLLKHLPDNPSLNERIGYCYALQSKWNKAEQYYQKATSLSPGNSEILNNYGCILQKQNRWEEALPCFADAFQISPGNFNALSNLAQTLNHCGHKEDALAYYEHALTLQPQNLPLRFQYADLLHENGRFELEADQYRQILADDSSNGKATIKLAVTLFALGEKEKAIETIEKSSQDKTLVAQMLFEKASQLHENKQHLNAAYGFGLLTLLSPDNFDVWKAYILNHYFHFGLEETLPVFELAIKQFPNTSAFYRILTIAYGQAGEPDKAVDIARKTIEITPEDPKAHQTCAVVLRQSQKCSTPLAPIDEVCGYFNKAIRLAEDNDEILQQIAQSIVETKEVDLVKNCLEHIPEQLDDSFLFHLLQNYILTSGKSFEEALQHARKAIALAPANAFALSEMSETCFYMENYDEALKNAQKAVETDPKDSQALMRLGYLSVDCGKIEEGLKYNRMALEINPHDPAIRLSYGLMNLLTENWEEGWKYYEARFQMKHRHQVNIPPVPKWDGTASKETELVIVCEQGLGDIIQFARFLPFATQKVGRTIFLVNPLLKHMFENLPGNIEVLSANSKFTIDSDRAKWISLIELTRQLEIPEHDWGQTVPYIQSSPGQVEKWKPVTNDENSKIKIGLAWQGSPGARLDVGRSIPLKHFEPISQLEQIQLYSLQKHYGAEQLDQVPFKNRIKYLGDNFDEGINAFSDTIAVMENLDLIITSDTAIAHLAGALGKNVWVALKHVPDWRWGVSGETTPWYPQMRLFRQKTPGIWEDVFQNITSELKKMLK